MCLRNSHEALVNDAHNFDRHMFFTMKDKEEEIAANVDKYMDSYARDTNVDELNEVWLHLETSRVLH